jgi:hypothetical protein
VVFEATYGWSWFADLLADTGIPAHMAHPLATKAIAAARVKNDAVDAKTLAHLLRTNLLAEAWIAPPDAREARRLVRTRAGLVRMRSRVQSQLHALLADLGVIPELTTLFGPAGRRWLAGLRIKDMPAAKVAITVGPRPPGWIRVGQGTRWPTIGENLMVLPRSHHQAFDQGRGGPRARLVITETRGQYGPLRSGDTPKLLPQTSREAVTVRGYPALLDHDPVNHFLEVTWREPGGIELEVHAEEELGRRQLLAIAEGLRQP